MGGIDRCTLITFKCHICVILYSLVNYANFQVKANKDDLINNFICTVSKISRIESSHSLAPAGARNAMTKTSSSSSGCHHLLHHQLSANIASNVLSYSKTKDLVMAPFEAAETMGLTSRRVFLAPAAFHQSPFSRGAEEPPASLNMAASSVGSTTNYAAVELNSAITSSPPWDTSTLANSLLRMKKQQEQEGRFSDDDDNQQSLPLRGLAFKHALSEQEQKPHKSSQVQSLKDKNTVEDEQRAPQDLVVYGREKGMKTSDKIKENSYSISSSCSSSNSQSPTLATSPSDSPLNGSEKLRSCSPPRHPWKKRYREVSNTDRERSMSATESPAPKAVKIDKGNADTRTESGLGGSDEDSSTRLSESSRPILRVDSPPGVGTP